MDYYCSAKFTELMVHVQSRLLYNCCAAYPERVDLDWLEANPGRLFHTDTMVQDRRLMLENKSCESCHYGCYKDEEQGLTSHRSYQNHTDQRISNPHAPMKQLLIMLSTDCNLSCVYCSPEFSTGWQKEITQGGEYNIGGHKITNNKWNNLWSKMKQKDRGFNSRFFDLLLNEISLAKDLKKIGLLGGEPLLDNNLFRLIEHVRDKTIFITTGLGINDDRLKKFLKRIKGMEITFRISVESTNRHFEFIRHGLSWIDFKRKVNILEEHGVNIEYASAISNLSVTNFDRFHDYSGGKKIILSFVGNPLFLSPHVLDPESKEDCMNKLKNMGEHAASISKIIQKDATRSERDNVGEYLKQLSSRRHIGLDFLPESFLRWCGIAQ